MFEDDVCVGLLGVLDERPKYAIITFSGFFGGPCTGWPKVIFRAYLFSRFPNR